MTHDYALCVFNKNKKGTRLDVWAFAFIFYNSQTERRKRELSDKMNTRKENEHWNHHNHTKF